MKTAVEWLVNQIGQHLEMNIKEAEMMIEQAKAMEKEQIIKTASEMHEKGFDNCINSMDTGVGFNHKQEARKYYNETFKTDKG